MTGALKLQPDFNHILRVKPQTDQEGRQEVSRERRVLTFRPEEMPKGPADADVRGVACCVNSD